MKQHYYLKGILLFLCLFAGINTFAYDAEIEGIYYNFNGDNAEVTCGVNSNAYSGDVVIPASVTYNSKTYSVASIGYGAFSGCRSLTSITIPNSVTSIEDDAFYGCSELTTAIIQFGDSIVHGRNLIVNGDFSSGYEGFTTDYLYIEEMGEKALSGEGLCAVGISPKDYYNSNFVDHSDHTSGTGNMLIANGSSNNLDYVWKQNVFVEKGKTYEFSAWLMNVDIYSIGVPSRFSNEFIEYSINGTAISASYDKTENDWERFCWRYTATESGEKEIKIRSVSEIREGNDFAIDDISLYEINTYEDTETSIGNYAFANCPKLRQVFCYSRLVPDTQDNAFEGSNIENATLYVPAGSVNLYQAVSPWNNFGTIQALDDDSQSTLPDVDISVTTIIEGSEAQPIYAGGYITNYAKENVIKKGIIVSKSSTDMIIGDDTQFDDTRTIGIWDKGQGNTYPQDIRFIDCTNINEEQFFCALRCLMGNTDYYVRAFLIEKNNSVVYGDIEKIHTQNYNRSNERTDIANVWYNSNYTLFDLMTDEIIDQNTGFYYSTNENPTTVRYQSGTGSNTCYKFATVWNYKLWYYHSWWCDESKIVSLPIMKYVNGKVEISKAEADNDKDITIYYCINGDGSRPENFTQIYSEPLTVDANSIVYCYAISLDDYMSYTNRYLVRDYGDRKYTLTYMVDSEVYKTLTIPSGSPLTPEEAPTKEGYTFMGWEPAIPKTMPEYDLTVVAQWQINNNAYDACLDGIYYNFSGDEAEVTYLNTDYNSFSGRVVIPASVTYNSKTYSVTRIGEHAFAYCNSLNYVTIPNSVTSIGNGAFWGCSNLTRVSTYNETPFSINSNCFSNRVNATLYVPYGCKDTYEAADYWNEFKEIIEMPNPNSITVGSSGYATFSSQNALDFSEVSGIKAYIASDFAPSTYTLTLTRITEAPAEEGLYIVGTPGTYVIDETTTDDVYSNLLKGITYPTTISPTEGDYTNFILANGKHGVAFYTISEAGELAAGKAYLQLPTASVSEVKAISVIFDDDDEDGISSSISAPSLNGEEIYNLAGQRIDKAQKGIYIAKQGSAKANGKKIFIK